MKIIIQSFIFYYIRFQYLDNSSNSVMEETSLRVSPLLTT